jgi:hypothetical protein
MVCFDPKRRLEIGQSGGRNLTTKKEIKNALPRSVCRLDSADGILSSKSAHERTRTSTGLPPLEPKSSVPLLLPEILC